MNYMKGAIEMEIQKKFQAYIEKTDVTQLATDLDISRMQAMKIKHGGNVLVPIANLLKLLSHGNL